MTDPPDPDAGIRLLAVQLILRQWASGMDAHFACQQIDMAVNAPAHAERPDTEVRREP